MFTAAQIAEFKARPRIVEATIRIGHGLWGRARANAVWEECVRENLSAVVYSEQRIRTWWLISVRGDAYRLASIICALETRAEEQRAK